LTPTSTPSNTPTSTATASVTPSQTPTNPAAPTDTPTASLTPAPSNTPTLTATYTPTGTPTNTATATATLTPTNTPIPSTSTGYLSPSAQAAVTTGAGDNNGYQTNPAHAFVHDSLFAVDANSGSATGTGCTGGGKDKHIFYNYGVNLSPTAVVQGIQVRVDARADATGGSPKICVQISWDGGTTWTTAKQTPTLTTTETTHTLGSSIDTWGHTWTVDDLSNVNFRLRVIDVSSNTSRDFSLDYIAVNVTYQP